jgi:hypothetical protein
VEFINWPMPCIDNDAKPLEAILNAYDADFEQRSI